MIKNPLGADNLKYIYKITSILLIIFVLTGCINVQDTKDNPEFTAFTEELFRSEVNSDSLTLNYTLSHPENYGITELPEGFTPLSYEDLASSGIAYENLLATLETYDMDSLSLEQQILCDTLRDTLETNCQGARYTSFSEALGPTTGIQAQLPVLLAEFRIEDRDDLEQYFSLLITTPNYFRSLLDLEKKKKELGTLSCRTTLEHIIGQCKEFLQTDGLSLLTKTFEKKTASFSFLSEQERKNSIARNSECILKYLTPAYQELISGLETLLSAAPEDGSLSTRPQGSSYYAYLVHRTTGSSLSISELESLLTGKLETAQETLMAYAKKDPSLFRSCQRYTADYSSPDSILTALQKRIPADFPKIDRNSYEIKYVDEALEEYLSPAFYLTPPIDGSDTNVIYINNSSRFDASSLFNTLAHEGYPGHLYQTCYMHSRNLPKLRYILDYGGYTEGWATYAEIYSYKYTGVSKNEVGILRNNMIVSLCLYGLCDLGVHARGWSRSELLAFLNQYGSWSSSTADSVYDAVVDEPASYLKYTVGYLEFMRLKEKMKKKLGDSYSEKNFHTYVLDMGPTSFDILEQYIEKKTSY